MKILLVITKGEIGGAQIAVLSLAKFLASNNIEVVVGFGEGNYLKEELDKFSIPAVQFKWLLRSHNPLASVFFIDEIRKYLNTNKFDIIHFNSSNALCGGLGAKLSKNKPKTFFTFHGLSMLDDNYGSSKISKLLYRLFFKFFLQFIDRPVFVCNNDLQKAVASGLVTGGDVIYNGLDSSGLNFLPRENTRTFLGTSFKIDMENKFIFGSIGRLAYPKNYEFIINIFPKILEINNNACFVLIGEGPEKQKYIDLIKKLNLENNIFLLGSLIDAYKYIKSFDLFVLPSIFEGLSVTLIETLHAGVPILTSKVGGSIELLVNNGSQLYALNDEQEFMEKAGQIMLDIELAKRLSETNKTLAKNYSLDSTFDKYLTLYNN